MLKRGLSRACGEIVFEPSVNEPAVECALHFKSHIFHSIARAIDGDSGGESVCFNHE